MIWYDRVREFNMVWKAERGQLNLAYETKDKNMHKKKNLKQTPVSTKSGRSSRNVKAIQM